MIVEFNTKKKREAYLKKLKKHNLGLKCKTFDCDGRFIATFTLSDLRFQGLRN